MQPQGHPLSEGWSSAREVCCLSSIPQASRARNVLTGQELGQVTPLAPADFDRARAGRVGLALQVGGAKSEKGQAVASQSQSSAGCRLAP